MKTKREIKKILGPFVRPMMYLVARYIVKKKFSALYLSENIEEISFQLKNVSFFGYYNIHPINRNNSKVLFCVLNSDEQYNSYETENIKVAYYDFIKKEINNIGISNAWNWQQGCMLQWFNNSNEEVIYNDYNKEKDQYYSKIVNIRTKKERKIILPVYAISNNGEYAITLNFDRLTWLRPDYGYFTKKKKDILDFKNDGIWKIDLNKNSTKLLISLQELKDFSFVETMNSDMHKVNHIDISPDSEHFMFLYRWFKNGIKHTRLMVADKNGQNLKILCGDKMVSHCIWKNNKEIVGFAHCEKYGNKYYTFNIENNDFKLFYSEYLSEDGHPSFDKSGRFFLTDTYPKRERFSKLLMIDTQTNKFYTLGEFFQPLKYLGSYRVDLHPRFSNDGKFISIDSGHTGKRKEHLFRLKEFYD